MFHESSRALSPEIRIQALRGLYWNTMEIVEEKARALGVSARVADPQASKLAVAWEAEQERKRVVAARMIAEKVGKEETAVLREAVAPEELKEVLRRAGAGYEVFMIIGEGKEELRPIAAEREEKRTSAENMLKSKEGIQRAPLERLYSTMQNLNLQLETLEEKRHWNLTDAGQHRSLQNAFLETWQQFQASSQIKIRPYNPSSLSRTG